VVVAPSTAPRDGRFLENVGHYNPREDPPLIVLKEERIFHWLSVGAQPTDSVKRLFESKGVIERYAQFKANNQEAGEAVSEAEVAEVAE
jgi:small subunit ribosomal protein S16